ncbi:unnamed protein product [Allacma fusca]|uniref:Uncharacterized protein n=1 Tax=Allacma fusca TaxID=39272 RepID=A0A8J2LK52_9HEXA|nr:unnamed protein product [Allacma fusca]
MTPDIKILVFLSLVVLVLGITTPPECCQWTKEQTIADRCTEAGTFKSKSKCFLNTASGYTDRSDYFKCGKCGKGWCVARLKCPQPCLMYLNGENCDCWNYFNEAKSTCDSQPPAALPPCPDEGNATTTEEPTS